MVLAVATSWISSVDVASISLNPFYRYRSGQSLPSGAKKFRVVGAHKLTGGINSPGCATLERSRPAAPSSFAAAATISGKEKPRRDRRGVLRNQPGLHWRPRVGVAEGPRARPGSATENQTGSHGFTAVAAMSGVRVAMGRQQKGFEKLLAVLGARLGTWLPNANFVANLADAERGTCIDPKDNERPWPKSLPSIRGAGYYYRELIGLDYPDAASPNHRRRPLRKSWTGRALRRRSRLIFCIDGGGDTPPLASGMADALRLAEYELGVTIMFTITRTTAWVISRPVPARSSTRRTPFTG